MLLEEIAKEMMEEMEKENSNKKKSPIKLNKIKEPKESGKPKRPKKVPFILGCVVVVVAIAGGLLYHFLGGNGAGGNAETAYVTTVSTLTEAATGNQNRYAGVVEPQRTVEVKIDSGRTVSNINVEVGQSVKAGDVLFEYDTSVSENDLAQARLDLERYKTEAVTTQSSIDNLRNEKARASADEQLAYTIEIQTAEMDLKKNEYNQKSKQAEIEKLEKAAITPQVTSEIDGVIRTVNSQLAQSENNGSSTDGGIDSVSPDQGDGSGSSSTFISIVATGSYRVRGQINETNIYSIVEGDPVIVRSRVDKSLIWRGTMGSVDTEDAQKTSTDSGAYSNPTGSSEEPTTSTTYPFYVNLESTEGLILGQHVYIEMDYGQEEAKEGLWINEAFIADADSDAPYVWASDDRNRLEKRNVTLGEYDEELGEYQVTEGLTTEDCIAYPEEWLEEGIPTEINDEAQTINGEDLGADGLDPSVDGGTEPEGNGDSGEPLVDSGDSGESPVDSSEAGTDSGGIMFPMGTSFPEVMIS